VAVNLSLKHDVRVASPRKFKRPHYRVHSGVELIDELSGAPGSEEERRPCVRRAIEETQLAEAAGADVVSRVHLHLAALYIDKAARR
jgi:hypothetical protein